MSALATDSLVLSEEDRLRARLYSLLACLLGGPPEATTLAVLRGLGRDSTPLGSALGELADTAASVTPELAEREYTALFVGLTEGEVQPFACVYKTGFLYEKPLAELRADLRTLGVAAAEDVAEPEDHIAALCEVMRGLIVGDFGEPVDLATQKRFFAAHIADWAARFFNDLEAAEAAVLYRPVARVGAAFLAIEGEAFAMA